jgi:hypothetical protein
LDAAELSGQTAYADMRSAAASAI